MAKGGAERRSDLDAGGAPALVCAAFTSAEPFAVTGPVDCQLSTVNGASRAREPAGFVRDRGARGD
jgi:hypothetical protein